MCKFLYRFLHRKVDAGMYDIFDIAYWFLNKASMPQKKLQKLCYYAQAWYKAIYNKRLISGSFEAWVHGPVNRKLWSKTTQFGYSDITTIPFRGKVLPTNIIDFLNDIYFTYGGFDGDTLERQTHNEKPWIDARKGLDNFDPSTKEIDLELMGSFYRSIATFDVNAYANKAN